MTTEHDYAKALEYVDNVIAPAVSGFTEDKPSIQAIRHALKLAEKLQEGPSSEMARIGVTIGMSARLGGSYTWDKYMADLFKAMRDQMLKELTCAGKDVKIQAET